MLCRPGLDSEVSAGQRVCVALDAGNPVVRVDLPVEQTPDLKRGVGENQLSNLQTQFLDRLSSYFRRPIYQGDFFGTDELLEFFVKPNRQKRYLTPDAPGWSPSL